MVSITDQSQNGNIIWGHFDFKNRKCYEFAAYRWIQWDSVTLKQERAFRIRWRRLFPRLFLLTCRL